MGWACRRQPIRRVLAIRHSALTSQSACSRTHAHSSGGEAPPRRASTFSLLLEPGQPSIRVDLAPFGGRCLSWVSRSVSADRWELVPQRARFEAASQQGAATPG
jgi:hypothetical protein